MIVGGCGTKSFRHAIRDHEQGHVPAAAQAGRSFVPSNKQHAAFLPRTAVQYLWDKPFQEIVAHRDRAIVHVIARIGDDQRIVRSIWIEVCKISNIGTTCRRKTDVGETDCRVMFAGIKADAIRTIYRQLAREAIRRYVFRKDLPGFACRFDLIGKIPGAQVVHTVARRALRRAAKEREVIRLGGMGDRGVIRRQAVLRDQVVKIRRVGAAHNVHILFVFHHDRVNVAESR